MPDRRPHPTNIVTTGFGGDSECRRRARCPSQGASVKLHSRVIRRLIRSLRKSRPKPAQPQPAVPYVDSLARWHEAAQRHALLSALVAEATTEVTSALVPKATSLRQWAEQRVRWCDATNRRAQARAAEYSAAAEIANIQSELSDGDMDSEIEADAAARYAAERSAWAGEVSKSVQPVIDMLNECIDACDTNDATAAREAAERARQAGQDAERVLARETTLPEPPVRAQIRAPGEMQYLPRLPRR